MISNMNERNFNSPLSPSINSSALSSEVTSFHVVICDFS